MHAVIYLKFSSKLNELFVKPRRDEGAALTHPTEFFRSYLKNKPAHTSFDTCHDSTT